MPLSALHRQDIGLEAAPFIAGRYLSASGLAVTPHVNPSTGEVQAELHLGGAKEIDLAVRAAKAAQVKWMAMTPYARIACFKRLHALLGEHSVQLGGERLGGDLEGGFFISPAVFADIRQGAAVEQNEVFGPVLSVIRFATDEEALSIANGTRYGLGAYLHTSDLDRAHDFAERLQAGYVNVNGFAMMAPMSPFGGYKQSGFGRVGGWAGMEEYLQTKNVFIARRQLKA